MSHFTFSTLESLLLAPRAFSHIKLEMYFSVFYVFCWTSKMVILTSQGKELFLLAIKYFFPKTATKTHHYVCNELLTFRPAFQPTFQAGSSVFGVRGKCLVTEAPIIRSRWAFVADGNFPVNTW